MGVLQLPAAPPYPLWVSGSSPISSRYGIQVCIAELAPVPSLSLLSEIAGGELVAYAFCKSDEVLRAFCRLNSSAKLGRAMHCGVEAVHLADHVYLLPILGTE